MAVEIFDSAAELSALKADTATRVLINDGAGGRVDFTLPGAAVAGAAFEFANTTGATGLRIYPFDTDTIRIEGSVTSAGGYINTTADGATIRLVCLGAGRWVAMGKPAGTWTVV